MQSTAISIPYQGGLAEKTAQQLIEPGSQTSILNGVFTKTGAIEKRRGTTKIGPVLAGALRALVYGAELLAIDGAALYSYSPGLNAWTDIDQVSPCLATRVGVSQPATSAQSYDHASDGVFECRVWATDALGNGWPVLIAEVVDAVTGAIVAPVQFVSANTASAADTVQCPKVFVAGNYFVIVWTDSSAAVTGTHVFASHAPRLAMTSTPWSAPTTIATDCASTQGVFDAQPDVGIGEFVTAYELFSGAGLTGKIRMSRWDANSFAQQLTRDISMAAGTVAVNGIGVCANVGERAWVAWAYINGADTKVQTVSLIENSWAVGAAEFNVFTATAYRGLTRIAPVRTTATHVLIAASVDVETGAALAGCTWWQGADGAGGGPLGLIRKARRLHMQSRPFIVAGRVYLAATFLGNALGDTLQGSCFVVDLEAQDTTTVTLTARPVATIAPRITTSQVNRAVPFLCSVIQVSGLGAVHTTASFLLDVNESGTKRTGIYKATLDYSATSRWAGAALGVHINMSGGTPSLYEGNLVTELGFLWYPEGVTGVAAAGGNLQAGTYEYRVCYEWFDAKGQQHQSAPSVALSKTVNLNDKVTLTIPTLNLTTRSETDQPAKLNVVYCVVYRTTIAPGGGAVGTTFFRVPLDNPIAPTYNEVNLESVQFIDTTSDATLLDGTHVPLYDQGGELDHVCPGSAGVMCVHRDRLWLGACDDPRLLWFSSQYTAGNAPFFNELLTIRCDEDVVAIAEMDDKLIVWSARSIFYITGDGPASTGDGSDLSSPIRLTSDVGCIEPRSIVKTNEGILFQSAGGLYMLDRSLTVSYFGKNVENSLGAHPTITSAVLLDDQAHQRFSCDDGNGNGIALVHDDTHDQWSTFSYGDGAAATGQVIVDAIKWGNAGYVFVTAGGQFFQELPATDGSASLDGKTQWVPLVVESCWFKMSGAQGFGRLLRVMFLGELASYHGLTMDLGFDYEQTYPQTFTWTSDALAPFAVSTREQIGIHVGRRQKCEAVRVRMTDSPPTGGTAITTGAGVKLLALDLEYQPKEGLYKRQSTAATA